MRTFLHEILKMQNAFNDISETKFICEGSSDAISCPPGSIIHVEYANYGRTSPRSADICDDSRDSNQACMAAGSADIITQRCDGMEYCSLNADNGVFGDPCGGTSKYIEVRFTCTGKCIVEVFELWIMNPETWTKASISSSKIIGYKKLQREMHVYVWYLREIFVHIIYKKE